MVVILFDSSRDLASSLLYVASKVGVGALQSGLKVGRRPVCTDIRDECELY